MDKAVKLFKATEGLCCS